MSKTKSVSVKISTSSRLWANDIGLVAKYTTKTLSSQQTNLEVWEDEHGSFDLRQPDIDKQPTVEHDGSTFVRFNSYQMQSMTSMMLDGNLREIPSGHDQLSIVVVARVSKDRIETNFGAEIFDRHPTRVGTLITAGTTTFNVFRNLEEDGIELEVSTKNASARWDSEIHLENRWRTYVFNADSSFLRTVVDGQIKEPDQQRGADFQSRDAGPIRVGFWQRDRALLDIDVAAILVFRKGPSLMDLQSKSDDLFQSIYPVVDIVTSSSLTADTSRTVRASTSMESSSEVEAHFRIDYNDLEDTDIWYSALDEERLSSNPIATWHDQTTNNQNLSMHPDRERQPLYITDSDSAPVVRFPDNSLGSTELDKLGEYSMYVAYRPGKDSRQLPFYITSALQVWLRQQSSGTFDLVIITNPGFLAQRSARFEEVVSNDEFFDLFVQGEGDNNLTVFLNGQEILPDELDTLWNNGYPLKYSTGDEYVNVSNSSSDASWKTTFGRGPIVTGLSMTTSGSPNNTGMTRTFEIQHSGLLVLGEADDSEYAQFALFERELDQDEREFVRDYMERHHK